MNPDSNNFQPGNQPATPAPAGPTPPTPPTPPATPQTTLTDPINPTIAPTPEPEIPLEADGFPVMPEPSKKKNTTRIVLIVILALVIIGCGVAAAIILMNPSKGGNPGGSNGTPTSNPDIPDTPDEPSKEEVALTDKTIIDDVNNKLGIMMGVKWENDHAEAGGIIFRDMRVLTEGDLEQSEKAFSALSKVQPGTLTEEQKQTILKENDEYFTAVAQYRSDKSAENARAEFGTMTVTYDAGTIREEYKKIYGEELPKGATIDPKSCGYFGYNESFDIYFMESGCGGASNPRYYYANQYTTDDSNVYVYISAGFIDGDETSTKVYCNITDYGNYSAESKICGEVDINSAPSNMITKENYQNFSQYRVTFTKKSDGNYYFSSAESL